MFVIERDREYCPESILFPRTCWLFLSSLLLLLMLFLLLSVLCCHDSWNNCNCILRSMFYSFEACWLVVARRCTILCSTTIEDVGVSHYFHLGFCFCLIFQIYCHLHNNTTFIQKVSKFRMVLIQHSFCSIRKRIMYKHSNKRVLFRKQGWATSLK